MKNLMIVESPSKIKKLKEILGSNWDIAATYGHIMDLPSNPSNGIGVDETTFTPHYEPIKGKEKVISNIKNLAKKYNKIYIATDPDREGEAIAWHVSKILPKGKEYYRVTFNAITKKDVLTGIKNYRDIDYNLKNAQEARRIADRIIGYKLSPLLSKYAQEKYNIKDIFSVGRVQTPAIKIVSDRCNEIKNFKPVPYWTISAILDKDGIKFRATHPTNYKSKEEVLNVFSKLGNSYKIKNIRKFDVISKPPMPFVTSTLQQIAHSYLGFSPSKTMALAQELYASGKITYLRTDSPWISDDGIDLAGEYIKSNFGSQYYYKRNYEALGIAQEAHECIRPTSLNSNLKFNNKDEELLYNLIKNRFLASQMADALYYKVEIEFDNNGVPFKSIGKTLKYDGYQRVLNTEEEQRYSQEQKKDENMMPLSICNFTEKDIDKTKINGKASINENKTKPPSYLNDATLVKMLETNGIGRPSTYASIINNIKSKKYVIDKMQEQEIGDEKDNINNSKGKKKEKIKKKSSAIITTEKANILKSFINEKYVFLHDLSYTKKLEDDLDDIAKGNKKKEQILRNILATIQKNEQINVNNNNKNLLKKKK